MMMSQNIRQHRAVAALQLYIQTSSWDGNGDGDGDGGGDGDGDGDGTMNRIFEMISGAMCGLR